MMQYNRITAESFGSDLPETWEQDAAKINTMLDEAGIPEYGEMTRDERETMDKIWEDFCRENY